MRYVHIVRQKFIYQSFFFIYLQTFIAIPETDSVQIISLLHSPIFPHKTKNN